jgi:DNA-binding NarL/FixJ family response regulator
MMNVVIVEDNDVIRSGMQLLINSTSKYNCTASFPNCEDALEYIKNEKPAFLLIDLELPGMSGIEGIQKVRELSENTLIIVLTVYGENERLFEAVKMGAFGYILKNTPSDKILKMLDYLVKGESIMSVKIALQVLNVFENKEKKQNSKPDPSLTDQEKQILKSMVDGNSPKAVADSITTNINAIYANFFNIYKKLHYLA